MCRAWLWLTWRLTIQLLPICCTVEVVTCLLHSWSCYLLAARLKLLPACCAVEVVTCLLCFEAVRQWNRLFSIAWASTTAIRRLHLERSVDFSLSFIVDFSFSLEMLCPCRQWQSQGGGPSVLLLCFHFQNLADMTDPLWPFFLFRLVQFFYFGHSAQCLLFSNWACWRPGLASTAFG